MLSLVSLCNCSTLLVIIEESPQTSDWRPLTTGIALQSRGTSKNGVRLLAWIMTFLRTKPRAKSSSYRTRSTVLERSPTILRILTTSSVTSKSTSDLSKSDQCSMRSTLELYPISKWSQTNSTSRRLSQKGLCATQSSSKCRNRSRLCVVPTITWATLVTNRITKIPYAFKKKPRASRTTLTTTRVALTHKLARPAPGKHVPTSPHLT